MDILSIILVIFAFFIIILFHEFGHYLGCRIVNVKVEEFSIGLGKEVWSKKIGDTKYSLRLLPIGGYVLPEGEEYKKDQPLTETNFYAKSPWERLLIIALGPIFNYILAFIIFFFTFLIYDYKVSTEVFMVSANTPAEKAGLKPGDIIIRINSEKFDYYDGEKLVKYIHQSKNTIEIEVKRNNQNLVFKVNPLYNPQYNFYYIGFSPKQVPAIDINILRGITKSFTTIYDMTIKYVSIILSIFTGHIPIKVVYEQSAGPIGITKIMYDFANQGIYNYLILIGFINIVIGLFNLFPFPALDGGRILFILVNYVLTLISSIVKKNLVIEPEKEELFHKIGLAILLIFVVLVSYNDIVRLIRGESFIK